MGGASPIGALFLAHLPKHPKRSGFHPWFDDVWQIFVLVALGMHARILALRHSKCFANMCDPKARRAHRASCEHTFTFEVIWLLAF